MKTVLLYGVLAGVLIAMLQLVEYRYLVLEHSFEIYGGIVALIFSGLGIWLQRSSHVRYARPDVTPRFAVLNVMMPPPHSP